jgi:hypothetical protein
VFLNVKFIVGIGFSLRLLVAIWNGFFGPSPGARGDSAGMHLMAVDFPQDLNWTFFDGTSSYLFLLSKVYSLTTDALFWGCLLSCFAWLGSAVVLLKTMDLMSFSRRNKSKAMLVYVLLPSSIFITAITLRESYQLLFVNIAIYAALKLFLNKSFLHWFVLVPAIICISALHMGLFVFGYFIIFSTLIMLIRGRVKGFSIVKTVIAIPVITLIIFLGVSQFSSFSQRTGYSEKNGSDELELNLGGAVENYRNKGAELEGRAQYMSAVEIKGIMDLLLHIPKIVFSYLFEPMPWRNLIAVDFVVIFENLLRAWLIWRVWAGFRKLPAQWKSPLIFIFINYLTLEVIWSTGTINWGTALRHHLPSFGLLVVSAFVYSKGMTSRPKA